MAAALCRAFGHPSISRQETVIKANILENMDDMLARDEKEGSKTSVVFSGRCSFCDILMWEMWPSAVKYLLEKEN
jgi:hypothetical protein